MVGFFSGHATRYNSFRGYWLAMNFPMHHHHYVWLFSIIIFQFCMIF
jgi:hypothetical protein